MRKRNQLLKTAASSNVNIVRKSLIIEVDNHTLSGRIVSAIWIIIFKRFTQRNIIERTLALDGGGLVREEQALEVLRTNIFRKMCKRWLLLQAWIVIIPVYYFLSLLSTYVGFPQINFPSLPVLTPSPLQVVHVIPPIFSGSITAISVIVGFFSVSCYRFIQQCESWCDRMEERWVYLSKEIEQETKESETEVDDSKKIAQESSELVRLNIDAFHHLQEHAISFIQVYLLTSFVVLTSYVVCFLATATTTVWIVVFLVLTISFLSVVFSGLVAFMGETTFFHSHREVSGEKQD